jgi:hypothetical protein
MEGGRVAKLSGLTESVLSRSSGPLLDAGMTVEAASNKEAMRWAERGMSAMGAPQQRHVLTPTASVGREDWHAFLVRSSESIVALATMHAWGPVCMFLADTTVPGARRRGAQSALVDARALAARATGREYLVAAVDISSPGSLSAALANLARKGFELKYGRSDWIWSADS